MADKGGRVFCSPSVMTRSGGWIMSRYVFFCEVCGKEFAINLQISEMEKGAVKCSARGCKVHEAMAAFSAVTSKKS